MVVAAREAARMQAGTLVVILPDGGERYLSTSLFDVREKVELSLFNSMSRGKEPFHPLVPGQVSVYSCGPTAHAGLTAGECRRFLFSDLLCRYLSYRGFEVNHVMNITDLDDKTILGSEASGEELSDFTGRHIAAFMEDFADLGIQPASAYPRASEHVEDMVALARKLVERGVAYEKLRSLYFDISRFTDYGRLSGIDLDKIRLGATVDLDEYEKSNPRDFTLLKRSRLSELKRGIYTKTEWGNVRPSWHIQCAAMSMKHLGETYDIHTSGRELVFPHHENEIAIAGALTGKPLARYWLHCDQVRAVPQEGAERQERVSLADLRRQGFSGREIRFWLLSIHYRKPVACDPARVEMARRSLKRLDSCVSGLLQVNREGTPYADLSQLLYDLKSGFTTAMDDDLNMSAALAAVFGIVKRINSLLGRQRLTADDAAKLLDALRGIDRVLNVFDFKDILERPDVRRMITERNDARRNRDWAAADAIREKLAAMGVTLKDRRAAP